MSSVCACKWTTNEKMEKTVQFSSMLSAEGRTWHNINQEVKKNCRNRKIKIMFFYGNAVHIHSLWTFLFFSFFLFAGCFGSLPANIQMLFLFVCAHVCIGIHNTVERIAFALWWMRMPAFLSSFILEAFRFFVLIPFDVLPTERIVSHRRRMTSNSGRNWVCEWKLCVWYFCSRWMAAN